MEPAVGDYVRVDIPDETDHDHETYHSLEGTVVERLQDDAAVHSGDDRDAVLYRVDLETVEQAGFCLPLEGPSAGVQRRLIGSCLSPKPAVRLWDLSRQDFEGSSSEMLTALLAEFLRSSTPIRAGTPRLCNIDLVGVSALVSDFVDWAVFGKSHLHLFGECTPCPWVVDGVPAVAQRRR